MNSVDNNITDWRKKNVYRDRKFEHLINMLVEDKDTSIFDYNKDLMVFAATVGYNFNTKKPLPHNSADKIPISLYTYANTEDDGFIYLLALMEKRNASCLKDIHLQDSIKIFEEYCNGGLEIIDNWFKTPQAIADLTKLETIQNRLLEQLDTNSLIDNDMEIEVEF